MPFEKYYDETPPANLPACIHLRSKTMYVLGDHRNPDHPDEVGNGHTWCNKTQHVIGPDQSVVNRSVCVCGRTCFQETY